MASWMTRRSASVLAIAQSFALALNGCARGGDATVVFDFATNIDQAEFRAETRLLDFGVPETRWQLMRGWSADERWGDTTFVWAIGDSSSLRFFHFGTAPVILRLRCVPEPLDRSRPQTVAILVNGSEISRLQLVEELFTTYDVNVPSSVLRSGTNFLQFRYGRTYRPEGNAGDNKESRPLAVGWDWIAFGPPLRESEPATTSGPHGTVSLPFPSSLDYHVVVPPASRLRWQAIRPWKGQALASDAAVDLDVRWDRDAQPERIRVAARDFGAPGEFVFAKVAGGLARISFTTQPGADPPDGAAAGVTLIEPVLMRIGSGSGRRGLQAVTPRR
jgi:hypothetical protein